MEATPCASIVQVDGLTNDPCHQLYQRNVLSLLGLAGPAMPPASRRRPRTKPLPIPPGNIRARLDGTEDSSMSGVDAAKLAAAVSQSHSTPKLSPQQHPRSLSKGDSSNGRAPMQSHPAAMGGHPFYSHSIPPYGAHHTAFGMGGPPSNPLMAAVAFQI